MKNVNEICKELGVTPLNEKGDHNWNQAVKPAIQRLYGVYGLLHYEAAQYSGGDVTDGLTQEQIEKLRHTIRNKVRLGVVTQYAPMLKDLE